MYLKKIVSLLSIALIVCLNSSFIYKRRNFHKVKNDNQGPVIYRSGKLKKSVLEKKIKKHDIDVIINFAGGSPGDEWYDTEKAVSARNGVEHVDLGFSRRRLLTKENF